MSLVLKTRRYDIYVSDRFPKKYVAVVKQSNTNKVKHVYFGDQRYEQYFDKLSHYKHLDHQDKQRRRNYYSRHGKTATLYSAKYFAHKYLW